MDEIYDNARVVFNTPGIFEVEFIGDHQPRRLHILGAMRDRYGNYFHLIGDDGVLYNWAAIISAKRLSDG